MKVEQVNELQKDLQELTFLYLSSGLSIMDILEGMQGHIFQGFLVKFKDTENAKEEVEKFIDVIWKNNCKAFKEYNSLTEGKYSQLLDPKGTSL